MGCELQLGFDEGIGCAVVAPLGDRESSQEKRRTPEMYTGILESFGAMWLRDVCPIQTGFHIRWQRRCLRRSAVNRVITHLR